MIELRNLSKLFTTIDGPVDALRHINLTIQNGDIYGIIGMSGAGKSTLVRCINMLERPTEGTVLLDGVDLGELNKKQIQQVRRRITMIFQSFNLLMQRTCLENVMLPLKLAHVPVYIPSRVISCPAKHLSVSLLPSGKHFTMLPYRIEGFPAFSKDASIRSVTSSAARQSPELRIWI